MANEIVEQILWAPSATRSFNNIINYLQEKFTDREIRRFIARTEKLIAVLQQFPTIGRLSSKRKQTRILVLSKQTQLVYQYFPRKKSLSILLFWDTHLDHRKFKY